MANLIIYYSRSGENYVNGELKYLKKGNVEVIVDFIKEFIEADTFRVETKEPYPESDMETTEISKKINPVVYGDKEKVKQTVVYLFSFIVKSFFLVDGDSTSTIKSGAPYTHRLIILSRLHTTITSGSTIVLLSQSSCTSTGATATQHFPLFFSIKFCNLCAI